MENLPAALLNGVGVVGIVVIIGGLFWRALITGALITRREADSYRERAAKADELVAELTKQNTALLEYADITKAILQAVHGEAMKP